MLLLSLIVPDFPGICQIQYPPAIFTLNYHLKRPTILNLSDTSTQRTYRLIIYSYFLEILTEIVLPEPEIEINLLQPELTLTVLKSGRIIQGDCNLIV